MFLHLGSGVCVPLSEILYIQDASQREASEDNRRFWARCQRERVVWNLSEGNPRSLVLTDTGVYLSGISSLTLKKRHDLFLVRRDGGEDFMRWGDPRRVSDKNGRKNERAAWRA